MKTIIGLAGVKTSGKSTVANMIKDMLPNTTESALADKLKNVCAEVFNIERNQLDAQELKEVPFDTPKVLFQERIEEILNLFNIEVTEELLQKYMTNNIEGMLLETPRKIAQIVGTEVLRTAGNPDIHCDNVNLDGDIVVISDLRFPNEFSYFSNKDFNFVPLYIQRDEAEKHVTEDSHPSEKCVFEFSGKCIKINNNGSLKNTKEQIKKIIEGSVK